MSYRFNPTPILTSVSYGMNDIVLEDVTLPTQKKSFSSVDIRHEHVAITSPTVIPPLTYGTGAVLAENMAHYCNHSCHLSPTQDNATFYATYTLNAENTELSNFIRIEADKDMTVSLIYRSEGEQANYHQCILQTAVTNQAKLRIEIVNLLSENTNHFISIENQIEENSHVDILWIDMGGKNSISNLYSNLTGDQSSLHTQSVYVGQNETLKDMNYIAHLRGKESVAEMNLQGVLSDKSKKNLKFTIDFKTGCTGAVGREEESCLLLSDEARYKALPILLCAEDNVEGAHSAAAGQVDPLQLFYIMSRGFTKKEAIKMLVKAKCNAIIEELQDDDLRREIFAEIDRRL